MESPWTRLPEQAPFVLLEDLPIIERNDRPDLSSRVCTDVLPVPHLGNPETAKILLLNLNPGFVDEDIELSGRNDLYVEQNRRTLSFDSEPAFFCLSKKFSSTPGYQWWNRHLKELIQEVGRPNVLGKVMCIQYFPYHSKEYRQYSELLPSQAFSFHLVEQAMNQGKVIVIMRRKQEWLRNVATLADYPYIELSSPRSASISRKNVKGNGFDRIVEALR